MSIPRGTPLADSCEMRKSIVIFWVTVLFTQCDVSNIGKTVPPRPSGNATGATHGTVETFAIDEILLGDMDRNGSQFYAAWEAYGYNLDGLITTKDSTNACQATQNSSRYEQVDGVDGIDNATGSSILPLLMSMTALPKLSVTATQLVRAGAWTLQIQTDGLPVGGGSVMGVGAQIFVSGQYDQGTPSFDLTTDWPILVSSLADGVNIESGGSVKFEDAYIASDGTFVSGVPSERPIVVPVAIPTTMNSPASGAPVALTLRIYHAIITFTRTAADPTRLLNGTIAGVLDAQDITDAAAQCLHRMDTMFCGAAFDWLAEQILESRDILRDGTNAPGLPCDAISIGLGFTARQVANPTKVADSRLSPDPCDAGPEGAADATPD